jgi:hypothetical protein
VTSMSVCEMATITKQHEQVMPNQDVYVEVEYDDEAGTHRVVVAVKDVKQTVRGLLIVAEGA